MTNLRGGFVSLHRLFLQRFPERHIGRSLRFRWEVDSFIHTGCIRYVAWRWIIAATLRGSIRPYRLYSERGGRQIAAPTVTLVGSAAQPHRFYLQRGGRQIAAPTGVIPFNRTSSIRNVPGTAHRPFPTVSLIGVFFYKTYSKSGHVRSPNNCQLSIVNCQLKNNCPLSTVNCQLSRGFQKRNPRPKCRAWGM